MGNSHEILRRHFQIWQTGVELTNQQARKLGKKIGASFYINDYGA
jgi:hypothetical protein